MAPKRTYNDDQLVRAIAYSTSWRGTLRALGLTTTSAGQMRSVRASADRLGADYTHFGSQSRVTDDSLRAAVAVAASWEDLLGRVGAEGPAAISRLKGHIARLGLQIGHLASPCEVQDAHPAPDVSNLSRAGSMMAAAWLTMCGYDVSWPLEPTRYDLLATRDRAIRRVQVKTTTTRSGESWKVYLSTARGERRTYSPDEIDDFFLIDGDLNFYLIPVAVVGGLQAIHLRAYEAYRLPRL